MIGVLEEGTLGTCDGFLENGLFVSTKGSTSFFIDAGLLLGSLSTPSTSFLRYSLLSSVEDDACIGKILLSEKKSTSVIL
jgi:hypothetical protein